MYSLSYTNGILASNVGQIVDVRSPFYKRIDRRTRKASIEKLLISPDVTRKCSQVKRFLVPYSDKYLYSMHVTYRDSLKCQSIYETTKSMKRILRAKMLKYAMDNIHLYPALKSDIVSVIKILVSSWEFDGLITDIKWIAEEAFLESVVPNWNLTEFENKSPRGKAINLLLNEYKKIPLELMSHYEMRKTDIANTDMEDVKFKCPLILMRSNSSYAGFVAKSLDKGLPVSLFKIDIKE